MSTISIIVAIDKNNAIGKGNQLLCHLPNDLKYFKATTLGSPVIMGRKTFESLPNGALPNRRNIVLSRDPEYKCDGCELVSSLEDAFTLTNNEDNVFVIGGASIYKEAISKADKLYITHIDHSFDGADAFFPQIDTTVWKEVSKTENNSDNKNKYAHNFVIYEHI